MRLSEFLMEAEKRGCYWSYNGAPREYCYSSITGEYFKGYVAYKGSTPEYWYSPITKQYFKVSYDKSENLKPWLEYKLREESGVTKL